MGARDDHLIEDWILDTKPVIRSQSEADAVDFLVYHLEGAAEEELQLRLDEGKNTPEAVFRELQRLPPRRPRGSSLSGGRRKRSQYNITPIH